MTETQVTELHWERSRNGILFLRRADKWTVGLVVPNEDGSFCWKVPCQRRSTSWPANGCYPTEDLAIEGLYTALGNLSQTPLQPSGRESLSWERTDKGALLLKRDGHTLGLVIRLDDRCSYGWLHFGERGEPFPTEQAACDALLDRMDTWRGPRSRARTAAREAGLNKQ